MAKSKVKRGLFGCVSVFYPPARCPTNNRAKSENKCQTYSTNAEKTVVLLSLSELEDPSCRPVGSLCCESMSTALICGNKTLPAQLGRTVASQSRCHNNERNRSWTSYFICGFRPEKESVAVVYFCFCVQTESKTTAASGSGARAGNPPPAVALALWVDLERRRGSLLAACALPTK